MNLNIAVLPGDGIGPEIMAQGLAVLDAIAKRFNHKFSYNEALCGADAIEKVGDPFPEDTFQLCDNLTRCSSLPWDTLSTTMTLLLRLDRNRDCWLCAKNWVSSLIYDLFRLLNVCCTKVR